MKTRKQNQTAHGLQFLMVLSSDHQTGATGLAPAAQLSKDGAAFGAAAGAVSEIGFGWYKTAGNATDCNTLGPLILHATATGCDPCDAEFQIIASDPDVAASTYAGGDTTGTTTLLSRITGALPLASDYTASRASKLDNLDAAVSSRSTYAGADTSGTTTLLARVPGTVQPQTGDSFARLGQPAGASISADIAADSIVAGTHGISIG